MQELQALYHQAPALLYAGVFILGALVGSFLNVVIFRLPKMMHNQWDKDCYDYISTHQPDAKLNKPTEQTFNLAKPNSTCPKCHSPIKPWHNIPVISYLALQGKCANCKNPISIRYPIIEFVTAALSILPLMIFGPSVAAIAALGLVWCLVALTMIDIDHQLLPDAITLPLLWAGLLVNLWGVYTPIESAVIGAIAGYLSLWSVYWLFKLATGKEGMGYGDFKLLAALGAWMGWTFLPMIILLSSLVGAVLGIAIIVASGRDKAKPLPFGPYLAIAGLIAFFWGDAILSNYLQMFQF